MFKFSKDVKAILLAITAGATVIAANETLPYAWRLPCQILIAVIASITTPHVKES